MIRKTTLYPSRISCPSLPGTMKGIVMSVAGVSDVDVHYEERSLSVTFDDTVTSADAIIKKVGQEVGIAMTEDSVMVAGDNSSSACPM